MQSTATGRNYRTNKQLIEGIFGGWFYERSCEPKTIEAHHGSRDFASNTHLRGDVRCRALLRGVKSAVAKTLLSLPDLRYRALAEIRKQPGCHNVQGIAINRVTDERVGNNWSMWLRNCSALLCSWAALHRRILMVPQRGPTLRGPVPRTGEAQKWIEPRNLSQRER